MVSAIYVVRNDAELLKGSIDLIYDYVDEIIIVDNGSDNQLKIKGDKIKTYLYPYSEPLDMGAVRTFAVSKATQDWIIQIDADEYYPKESITQIIQHIKNHGEAISFRVPYFNVAWRSGYIQAGFEHYPDRIYKREVIDRYKGVLPNDMTYTKKGYHTYNPILEYDNQNSESFENPVQPIIQTPYYHLARCRGYNYEFNKWHKYNTNIHGNTDTVETTTRINQWVTGNYMMVTQQIPEGIPKSLIKNPKVSVVITNYNYKRFITECIDSVKNQTYKPFEIIVVDDHSDDGSFELLSKMEGITFLPNIVNRGVAEARNKGIAYSKGDYFICLDADDKIAPNFISRTLEEIGESEICYTDLKFFGKKDADNPYPDFSSKLLKQAQIIPSCCALIDRHVFEVSGGYDPRIIYEDWGWWLRLDQLEMRFSHVKEPLFNYREHGKSRIDELDSDMEKGYQELRDRFQIDRKIDQNRINEAKKICE